MPRVTVVTPAHDAAALLAETLDSVLAQRYQDYEVVVADDASSDATAELAESYGGRVRCVRSATNVGPAGARNLALEHASGELVALLDADDLWLPEYLQEQVALYDREQRRRPGVGIVGCDAFELAPEGRRERTWSQRVGASSRPTLTAMLRSNSIFVSAIAPRALVQRLGGFSAECWGSADHDLWLRILETGHRAVVNPRPLAVYRLVEGSLSEDIRGMAHASRLTFERALARGNLTPWQRVIARRSLRVQVAVEHWEQIAARRAGDGRLPLGDAVRAAPVLARVVLEHPNRWPRWARILLAARRGEAPPSR